MEVLPKPKHQKVDVPVHRTADRKTYGANFHSKRYKQKEKELPESENTSYKVSRKHLSKENARLLKENEEILAKFNELEELSVRKILKLKDKNSILQNENEDFKIQQHELLSNIEDLKLQLQVSKHCRHCEEFKVQIQKIKEENSVLKTGKKDLEEDVNMLKTVVYRLNVQLERYQQKLQSLNAKIPQNLTPQHQSLETIPIVGNHDPSLNLHQDHSHTPISWGRVNSHTLGPLLDAYQDAINEKDDIIESYEREISEFTLKLKEIVKENEDLHKCLTEDVECSAKLKGEVDSLKKELKTMKEQNDVLIKKCALKQDKLEEVLKCYEHKVEIMKRDYSVLHEQYCKMSTEAAALKEKNRAMIDAHEDFKTERQNYIPVSVHTSSVNECKKWYEELKLQYEQEKTKLKETVSDLERKLAQITKEKEDFANTIKHLEKQIKKSDAKYLELEHTLNEVQFAKSACRKQLNKAMNFAKDLVTEQEALLKVLNQRQQENKAVKKIGSDIATRMNSLRNQLKDVQKEAWEELSTVEKRIHDQNETIQVMKQEHNEEIERLQQIIKEQESNLLLKEQATLPVSQYSLFREKHKI